MINDKKAFITGMILLIIFAIIEYNNDYLRYQDRKCLVTDKFTELSGKHKTKVNFYLILKEDKTGTDFDLIVTPATWSKAKVGKYLHFNLRQMDIKQTTKDNLIYFIGSVFFGLVGVVFIIISFIPKSFYQ